MYAPLTPLASTRFMRRVPFRSIAIGLAEDVKVRMMSSFEPGKPFGSQLAMLSQVLSNPPPPSQPYLAARALGAAPRIAIKAIAINARIVGRKMAWRMTSSLSVRRLFLTRIPFAPAA